MGRRTDGGRDGFMMSLAWRFGSVCRPPVPPTVPMFSWLGSKTFPLMRDVMRLVSANPSACPSSCRTTVSKSNPAGGDAGGVTVNSTSSAGFGSTYQVELLLKTMEAEIRSPLLELKVVLVEARGPDSAPLENVIG